MTADARALLRLFDRALREQDPATAGNRRAETERRRIQRANGFDERGEPLS